MQNSTENDVEIDARPEWKAPELSVEMVASLTEGACAGCNVDGTGSGSS